MRSSATPKSSFKLGENISPIIVRLEYSFCYVSCVYRIRVRIFQKESNPIPNKLYKTDLAGCENEEKIKTNKKKMSKIREKQ